jgi:hypothetical protein
MYHARAKSTRIVAFSLRTGLGNAPASDFVQLQKNDRRANQGSGTSEFRNWREK